MFAWSHRNKHWADFTSRWLQPKRRVYSNVLQTWCMYWWCSGEHPMSAASDFIGRRSLSSELELWSCKAGRKQTVLGKELPGIRRVNDAHLCLINLCASVSRFEETSHAGPSQRHHARIHGFYIMLYMNPQGEHLHSRIKGEGEAVWFNNWKLYIFRFCSGPDWSLKVKSPCSVWPNLTPCPSQ